MAELPTIPQLETPVGRPGALANSALLTGYYIIDAGLLFVLTLLLARYLGVADFGKIAFALSYGLVLYVFSDPGISLSVTKFVARDPDPRSPWLADGLSLRSLLVIVSCTLGLLPFLFNHYLRVNALVLVPIICSEQLRGLTITLCSIFRGLQQMIFEVLTVACERVAVLAVALWVLRSGHGVEAVAWAFLGGRLLALVLALAILRLRIGKVEVSARPRLAGALLREAFPLAILLFAERINLYFAPLALTAISGEYAAGLFQSAFKIVTFPILLAGVVGGSLFPAMSAAHGDAARVQKLYSFGVRALWHALLPGAVLTLVFAPQVMRIIFGPQFVPAAPVLQLLTPYYAVYAMITVSYYLMPAVNEQRITMQLSVVSLGLNLIGGPLFMLAWGARGAAIGLIVTNLVVALSYWYRARKLGYHVMRLREDFLQVAGFALTLGAGFLLQHFLPVQRWYQLLFAALAITLFYGATLLVTRSLLPEELQLVADIRERFRR